MLDRLKRNTVDGGWWGRATLMDTGLFESTGDRQTLHETLSQTLCCYFAADCAFSVYCRSESFLGPWLSRYAFKSLHARHRVSRSPTTSESGKSLILHFIVGLDKKKLWRRSKALFSCCACIKCALNSIFQICIPRRSLRFTKSGMPIFR